MKRILPMMTSTFSYIDCFKALPKNKANVMQVMWASPPPITTQIDSLGFYLEAIEMAAICDLSPHSEHVSMAQKNRYWF